MYMQNHYIDIVYMQETHISGCPVFSSDGFLLIFSGHEDNEREYAGVGFIISPHICLAVKSFVFYISNCIITFENSWWYSFIGQCICSA